jgi:raffinose/stachyose/melibiose transport system permease protein
MNHVRAKPGKVRIVLKLVLLFFIAAIQLYPLLWLLLFSFKSNNDIFGSNIAGLPTVWHWENYSNALFGGGILIYFRNSVVYTAITIVAAGVLSAMSSYAISRLQWKLRGVTYILFTLGIMIPLQAVLLPLYLLLDSFKILNTGFALLIPYIAFAIPMSVIILCGFYGSVPKDIEEAAYLDGCNIYQVFFRVVLPMVRSAVATVSIFTFLGTWNELMFANTFVNDSSLRTLTVGIMSFVGEYSTNWGAIGAGMVIATLPTMVIYFFLSDQVQSSIVAGAVKG